MNAPVEIRIAGVHRAQHAVQLPTENLRGVVDAFHTFPVQGFQEHLAKPIEFLANGALDPRVPSSK